MDTGEFSARTNDRNRMRRLAIPAGPRRGFGAVVAGVLETKPAQNRAKRRFLGREVLNVHDRESGAGSYHAGIDIEVHEFP